MVNRDDGAGEEFRLRSVAVAAFGPATLFGLAEGSMIPVIARDRLAYAVDAFCETIAFTPEETERVFAAAVAHGLRVKLHAEQLSNSRGAKPMAKNQMVVW